MNLQTMYKGVPFSPITTLSNNIGAGDTVISVNDTSVFPPAPNFATIGIDENAETIQYNAITESALSGCVRGIEGIARTWIADSPISRNFTNEDYVRLIENINNSVQKEVGNANDIQFEDGTTFQEKLDAGELKGAPGVGVSKSEVTYQLHTSGTTTPTGTWLSTPPATSAGQFLWTRTVITYTNSTTTTMYFVSAHGATGSNGADGADAYTVILSNEAHTFAAGISAATAGTATCSVLTYKGTSQVAATIGTISGQVTGLTTSISSNGTTNAYFTVTVTTSLTTRSGVLTVPVTVDGKSFTKLFSWSLALTGATGGTGAPGAAGADGKDATAYYGICETAAATTAKTVANTAFSLTTGARIVVKFTYTNTAASPTLNVNSTGAIAIKIYSTTAVPVNLWQAGEIIEFVYDGTNWLISGGGIANTANNALQKEGGTMAGALVGATTAPETVAMRNISAGTTDLTAGSSTLATGTIYFVYE